METKNQAIDAESIHDLEDKLNEFRQLHKILFTQIFPTKKGYDCMVGYEVKGLAEPDKEQSKTENKPGDKKGFSNKPTAKQLWYLNENTVGELNPNLTFNEAVVMIKELKGNEDNK